jgi:hypothetical protein
VAIGNNLVLEESTPFGNQIVLGAAESFDPGKFSNREFAPHAYPPFFVWRFPYVNNKNN